jgi:hypothetical protein
MLNRILCAENPTFMRPSLHSYVESTGMSIWKEIQRDNLTVGTVPALVLSTDALLPIADVTQVVNS